MLACTLKTLKEHHEQLDHLAGALLERETLDEPDAYRGLHPAGRAARKAPESSPSNGGIADNVPAKQRAVDRTC